MQDQSNPIEATLAAPGGENALNALITFGLMWLLRQFPAWEKRNKRFDFVIPVVVSALEAGAATLVMGHGFNEAWKLAVSNLMGSVTAHKLLSDAPGKYNSKSVANSLLTGVVSLLFPLAFCLMCGTAVVATACTGQSHPLTPAQIAERQACLALADANKIQAGKRECLDRGIAWSACPAAENIKAQHREEMKACPY